MLKGNEGAIHFYERYGFHFDGTEAEIILGTSNTKVRMIYERNESKFRLVFDMSKQGNCTYSFRKRQKWCDTKKVSHHFFEENFLIRPLPKDAPIFVIMIMLLRLFLHAPSPVWRAALNPHRK